jgi:23S rRNA (guanine745-N1)-methyltransferase
MPLADASVDTLVNVFSPLAPEESRRVLRRGGKLIYVIPGADHLFQLKAKIYDEPYKNAPEEYTLPGFSLFDSEAVRFTMELGTPEEVRSLFMMTPYAYRTGKEGRERLMALRSLAVTADFEILIFERTH